MRTTRSRPIAALARADIRGKAMVAALALGAVAGSLLTESGTGGVLAAGLALVAAAIALVDARSFVIPDELNAAAILLGLAHAGVTEAPLFDALWLAALRGVMVALAFLAIRSGYRLVRGRDGLGLGDVKLALAAGIWLDFMMIPVAIEIAAGAALAVYSLRQLAAGRAIRPTGRLPFGLFLAPSIWIGWVIEQWLFAF